MARVDGSFYPLLRRRAAIEGGFATLAALALGAVVARSALLTGAFPVKAAALVLVLGVFASPFLHEHGRPSLGPANRITLARAVLVGLLAAFLGEPTAEAFSVALVLGAGLAFGLDWVDGRVARSTGSASPFGARLDMELDALTVLALSALAWQLDRAGPWVLLSGALRYLFVGGSFVWPWLAAPLPPAPRRAWICGVQVGLLVLCLAPWPVAWLSTAMAAIGVVALTGSFAIDVAWLYRNRP